MTFNRAYTQFPKCVPIDGMRKRLMRWLVETETDRPYVEKLFA